MNVFKKTLYASLAVGALGLSTITSAKTVDQERVETHAQCAALSLSQPMKSSENTTKIEVPDSVFDIILEIGELTVILEKETDANKKMKIQNENMIQKP